MKLIKQINKHYWYGIHLSIPLGILVFLFWLSQPQQAYTLSHYWQIRAIDTMKSSRDRAREENIVSRIPAIVDRAAELTPTHIAIGTPYDNEFLRVTRAWSREIHRRNISVWFRGNFSGWEGWFEYPLLDSAEEHHQKTYAFITNNPDLFQDGDIFTPAPEPENGLLGDPRFQNREAYFDFLIKSYQTCQNAFAQINKQVSCGYFGTNGDIAKSVLTPEVVSQLGNRIVIDHYVATPEILSADLEYLKERFPNTEIILGEFGVSVPDIHGRLTQFEQNGLIAGFLQVLYQYQDLITGVNYWVLNEGSTAITTDDLTPLTAFETLKDYYQPHKVTGTVVNSLSEPLGDVTITTPDGLIQVVSDEKGEFSFYTPAEQLQLSVSKTSYIPTSQFVTIDTDPAKLVIVLEPEKPHWIYRFRMILKKMTEQIPRS